MSVDRNIVLVCDAKYVIPTAVTIQTIKTNCTKTDYTVYIIADDLAENDIQKLISMSTSKLKIHIVKTTSSTLEEYNRIKENSYCVASRAALLKIKIPSLLPDLDRVLYLDSDLIVRNDLKAIFDINMDNYLCAAVPDSGAIYGGRQIQKSIHPYINSGVMLFNLKKMREYNSEERLLEIKKKMVDKTLMDQDAFNLFFENHVYALPIIYNYLYVNLIRARTKYTMEELNKFYNTGYKDLTDIRKASKIIHFASKDKPWLTKTAPLSDEWYNYFLNTPFKDTILDRDKTDEITVTKKLEEYEEKINALEKYISGELNSIHGLLSQLMAKNAERTLIETKQTNEHILDDVVVTLTSYPKRIKYVPFVIDSILNQTLKPSKIVLYLFKDEFTDDLPELLMKQINSNKVKIVYCPDYGSHKKYLRAMQDYSEFNIITIDDDVYYRSDMIEKLYSAHLKNSNAVCAMRTHFIKFDSSGGIRPYKKWAHRFTERVNDPSHRLFATGCAGVLYPPQFYDSRLFNESKILEYCKFGDDIWLKAVELSKDIKVSLADSDPSLFYLPGSQECGLYKTNIEDGKNDRYISNVFNYFNKELNTNLYTILEKDKQQPDSIKKNTLFNKIFRR